MRTSGAARAPISLAAALLLLLSGCSAAPAPKRSVALFQNRADSATRSLHVEITNRGDKDVVITATFTSDCFEGSGTAGHLPYTLVAGTTTDFPATVPPPVCDGPHTGPTDTTPTATIHVTPKGGSPLVVNSTPTVPFNSLGTLHAQDCGQQAFEKVASITPAPHLRFETRRWHGARAPRHHHRPDRVRRHDAADSHRG
ncbi:MAG: hypothetical protein H7279_10365 [Microbacteriaceae bacterium]|nr:hypothetical protein [Microbacteriaceae bacterium]